MVAAVGAESRAPARGRARRGDRLRGAARRRARVRRDARAGLPARRPGPLPAPARPGRAGRCASPASGGDPGGRRRSARDELGAPARGIARRWPRAPPGWSSSCAAADSARPASCSPRFPDGAPPLAEPGALRELAGRLAFVGRARRAARARRAGVRAARSRRRPAARHLDGRRARPTARGLLRRPRGRGRLLELATAYDRELVVECALLLMARLRARSASSRSPSRAARPARRAASCPGSSRDAAARPGSPRRSARRSRRGGSGSASSRLATTTVGTSIAAEVLPRARTASSAAPRAARRRPPRGARARDSRWRRTRSTCLLNRSGTGGSP